jgi:hypothetical protein
MESRRRDTGVRTMGCPSGPGIVPAATTVAIRATPPRAGGWDMASVEVYSCLARSLSRSLLPDAVIPCIGAKAEFFDISQMFVSERTHE